MKKLILPLALIIFCSWSAPKNIKGSWQFAGGIYNGKRDTASATYSLQRQYDNTHFDAYLLEQGQKPVRYQSGDYALRNDTCLETETFSAQPSKLTGVTLHYRVKLNHDTLVLSGTLPTGMAVTEYWKRVKQ